MTGASEIKEILAQYAKHGWILRRVLLSAATRDALAARREDLFGAAAIDSFSADAAWFSRRSAAGREAWELRRLNGAPFALVEVFEDEDDETVRDEARFEMEQSLLNG